MKIYVLKDNKETEWNEGDCEKFNKSSDCFHTKKVYFPSLQSVIFLQRGGGRDPLLIQNGINDDGKKNWNDNRGE